MATLIIEIEDKKIKFFKDLMKHFSFAKIHETDLDEDSDEEIITNVRQGIKEMKLVEQGKLKSRPAREFLKEL